jgi:hypothetical protein
LRYIYKRYSHALWSVGILEEKSRARISGVVGTNVDKKVVEIVEQRAGNYCEACGGLAQESMALHHRKLKSRGGKDTPANLIRCITVAII